MAYGIVLLPTFRQPSVSYSILQLFDYLYSLFTLPFTVNTSWHQVSLLLYHLLVVTNLLFPLCSHAFLLLVHENNKVYMYTLLLSTHILSILSILSLKTCYKILCSEKLPTIKSNSGFQTCYNKIILSIVLEMGFNISYFPKILIQKSMVIYFK